MTMPQSVTSSSNHPISTINRGGSRNSNGSGGFAMARPLTSTSTGASGSGIFGADGTGNFGRGGGSGTGSIRRHEEELINAYEAEEERIINLLSRKLEQLREDKIELENALEAESENHVNRLSRELGTLRQANRELEVQLERARDGSHAPETGNQGIGSGKGADQSRSNTSHPSMIGNDPGNPSTLLMLDALRRENEQLRNRLVDTERVYVRVKRLNEVYREELIDCRGRLGLPVDNLIGLTSSDRDPFSHSTHLRSSSTSSSVSASFSPSASVSVSGMAAAAGPSGTHHSYYDYGNGASASNYNLNSNGNSPSTSVFHGGGGAGIPMSYEPRFGAAGVHPSGQGHGHEGSVVSTNTSRTRAQAPTHTQAHHRQTHGVPIPRPSSQVNRAPKHAHIRFSNPDSDVVDGNEDLEADADEVLPLQAPGASQLFSSAGSTPSSLSAASSDSPYPFSPITSSSAGADPASYVTDVTSPPSSGSFGMMELGGMGRPTTNNHGVGMGGMVMTGMGMSAYGVPQRGLSYPSVPPPSLSSSFGSPTVGFHGLPRGDRDRDVSISPVEPLSRRGSNAGSGLASRRGSNTWEREPSVGMSGSSSVRRVVETGSLRRGDRGAGVAIGGRVAETGTLIGRSRAGSLGLNLNANFETVDEGDDTPNDTSGLELELALENVHEEASKTNPDSMLSTKC